MNILESPVPFSGMDNASLDEQVTWNPMKLLQNQQFKTYLVQLSIGIILLALLLSGILYACVVAFRKMKKRARWTASSENLMELKTSSVPGQWVDKPPPYYYVIAVQSETSSQSIGESERLADDADEPPPAYERLDFLVI